ncbi:GvpL/GvpF family gas vesicle protein [Streptomyces sp. NPDC006283]|uniref:GvpL/GvpF family gas vesicle protein n=1 Tax=Streptomyces sp. NPDC006283 TaxID=3156741 RepID=UPI0033B63C58
MRDSGVYVYAIIRSAAAPLPADITGVGSPPALLRVLEEGAVAAIVSDAPPKLRARRRDLLAHQGLLDHLADAGSPLIPMRFGMVAPDEATVRGQLVANEAKHLETLQRLADRVEINVKALPAEDALPVLVAEDDTIRRLRQAALARPAYDANLRLGEAVHTALTRRAFQAGQRMVRELTPMAHGVAAGPEVHGCVLNTSFLVDRGEAEKFEAAVRTFAEGNRTHVQLRVAGPLPCYSFSSFEPALETSGA